MHMKSNFLFLTFLSLILFASCKAQSGAIAVLKTRPNVAIEVKRTHIYAFLAEYDRFLTLKVDDESVAELQIATDTGGYSRANVYSTNSPNRFVVEDLQGFYEIDIAKKQISKSDLYPCKTPEEYIFIGAFDTDESKQWQFIPASKRKQMKVERGCIEKVK